MEQGTSEEAMTDVTTVSSEALRDYWHPVAFARDVTTLPQRARLLDERLVLFRTETGRIACFRDLCVHRGTPLSLGWVEGETIVCAYHGWTYAAEDGRCVRIPSVDEARSIPAKARVTAYAVSERYGLVWVCLDEPRAPIAAFPEYGDHAYRTFIVETEDWASSAARLIENFVDTAHFAWVHPGLLGHRDKPRVPPITIREDGGRIEVSLEMTVDTGVHKGSSSVIWDEITLPFTVRQVRTDPGGGHHVVFVAVSPTSARTLRRYVYKLRDYDLDAPDDPFIEKSNTVAAQDRAIVEEQRPEELPVDLAAEMHMRGPDDPAVVYRRALAAIGVEAA
jgi:phenylpropionate dioxygenase-like ring-hydroxylating dioxygenase large terminal subunit